MKYTDIVLWRSKDLWGYDIYQMGDVNTPEGVVLTTFDGRHVITEWTKEREVTPMIVVQHQMHYGSRSHGCEVTEVWDAKSRRGLCASGKLAESLIDRMSYEELKALLERAGKVQNCIGRFPRLRYDKETGHWRHYTSGRLV